MQKDKDLQDIMHYEPTIWAVADYLIAAGIKQSKFPDYMMPFFALVMLEGRMLNEMKLVEKDEGLSRKDNKKDFIEAFKDRECGYNEYIVEKEKTLSDICKSDKTFAQDFDQYLDGFDSELKRLLGIGRGTSEQKFLNMDGMKAELEKKGILMSVVSKWAEVDLSGYDNSAITTLEEHIKRRWADISAETAGEQYTPDDIISLIAELIGDNIKKPKDQFIKIYDPACGGANLLYGVADRLQRESGYMHIETSGSDFNDALYALAAIESRFRQDSHIKYGNTLTQLPFRHESFDVIVANPPYGISWKGYEKEIKKDESGQFVALPAVSDGQLLFMQHILWQLSNNGGFAVEVHNGSSLFSGDAGGGESEIRKYAFDNDWVEAIVQMPSDEFFNTGIYTYLWIFNKKKTPARRDKVLLIDASKLWTPMKKSKGSKRKYMSQEQREKIREAFIHFEDSEISKVFSKYHFYYNKQQLTLTDVDINGETVERTLCRENETDKGDVCKIALSEVKLEGEPIRKFVKLNLEDANCLFARLTCYDYKEKLFVVKDKNDCEYWYDKEQRTIIRKNKDGQIEPKGQGMFVFKLSVSKKTGSGNITLQIQPVYQKDYEIIPYVHDGRERYSFGAGEPDANEIAINRFLDEYIYKPYYKRDNIIGVELNFNKEFYVPEKLEKVEMIIEEIENLNSKLRELENLV